MKRNFSVLVGASLVLAASMSMAQSPKPTETQMRDNVDTQDRMAQDGDVTKRQRGYFDSLDREHKGYLNSDDVSADPLLTQNWEHTTEEGKDGLVRTFAGLCTASVAYQKRLEPALARALGEAEPKLLIRWTEIVLPALKGEPHARARAVVEERLPVIPRPQAQKIADFLGIKLRPLPR